jgi:hypothetical protein
MRLLHCHGHGKLLLERVLILYILVHTHKPYFRNIHLNIVLLSMTRSRKSILRFSDQAFEWISFCPCLQYFLVILLLLSVYCLCRFMWVGIARSGLPALIAEFPRSSSASEAHQMGNRLEIKRCASWPLNLSAILPHTSAQRCSPRETLTAVTCFQRPLSHICVNGFTISFGRQICWHAI